MTRELFACIISIFLLSAVAHADEPGWSEEKRAAERDVVVEASVLSTRKVHNLDRNETLHAATLMISVRHKGPDKLPERIDVYYEFSTSGHNSRCPRYAELKTGLEAKFFLRTCDPVLKQRLKLENRTDPVFFLAMGSDVITSPPKDLKP